MYSYVYVAFLITTLFSALYPGSCLLYNSALAPLYLLRTLYKNQRITLIIIKIF